MRWPWQSKEAPPDQGHRDRLSSLLADVSHQLTAVVEDLERAAAKKDTKP